MLEKQLVKEEKLLEEAQKRLEKATAGASWKRLCGKCRNELADWRRDSVTPYFHDCIIFPSAWAMIPAALRWNPVVFRYTKYY